VHGQSQHLSLLRARDQLDLLDRFAGLTAERKAMTAAAREVREVRERIAQSIAEGRAALREQDLLRFQVEEIGAAALQPDEEESLQARRSRLRNVERLRSTVHAAWEAVAGGDDTPGALGLVGAGLRSAQDAARLDAALEGHVAGLVDAESQLDDVERGLRQYLDALDADPTELEALEERALLLAELKRKYGATVSEVIDYLERARERLEGIEHGEERLAELRAREAELLSSAVQVATTLAESRRSAAQRLESAIETELKDLGLSGARFRVGFTWAPATDGLPIGLDGAEPQPLRYDGSGVDRVEFLFAANAGSEPRPLAHVASGGELARVSLAIKTALSAGDERATLIFDEVDVGVGGRTAAVVGRKLWELSRTHQVLCVTHLPQVAAYADAHLLVSKQERDGLTRSQVQALAAHDRVAELAAMLAGPQPTAAAQRSAEELLERAQDAKITQDANVLRAC
jgi:DNA repair protein RecN (Recombination protein N)